MTAWPRRSFTESMRSLRPDKPWSTKLSSAGLVYCHFGSQILAGLLGQPEDGPVVTALYDKVTGGLSPCQGHSSVQGLSSVGKGDSLW